MEEVILADRYAKALVTVAREANLIERVDKELSAFADLLAEQAGLSQVLCSPIVPFQDKEGLLQAILQRLAVSEELKSFLLLLLKMQRLNIFGEIAKLYKDFIYSLRKRLKVFVESAFALSAAQKEALKNKLTKIYRRNIDLFVSVNSGLIGGAKVYVGHRLYDGSAKTRLALLKRQLEGMGKL